MKRRLTALLLTLGLLSGLAACGTTAQTTPAPTDAGETGACRLSRRRQRLRPVHRIQRKEELYRRES